MLAQLLRQFLRDRRRRDNCRLAGYCLEGLGVEVIAVYVRDENQIRFRQSIEPLPAPDGINVNGLLLPPQYQGGMIDGMYNQITGTGGNMITVELVGGTGGRSAHAEEHSEHQRCRGNNST